MTTAGLVLLLAAGIGLALLGALVLIGRMMRGSAPRQVAPIAADLTPAQWRHADNPPLSVDQVGQMMLAIASRAGIAPADLPQIGPLVATDGTFIDRDKFDYIYIRLEEGRVTFDHRTVVADRLLYWVFSEWAANQAVPTPGAPPDPAKQKAALAAIEPRWADQFAREQAAVRQADGAGV